ncbi:J domain-containing protein [Bradyrhizobium sp. KBS0727]|jgi:curved DNA-binding protein CbpA|uniref:J domain-containing protein n=1 Tax=unclassified Bradyrhizobium TaxID=2631580 RepID=UPI00110E7FE0|nr:MULTISPECIES: DnaJ domain-containing protein [unclassified Bradyrhizobium]QDW39725.1 J domain-containing protein [Bradyrhizobium sp. KBS0725]QDW46328.1 J domain-containing protein [Bradyrhizobium sp. KBS0727]
MGTLYDLLGALPGDDADGLRAAFRRAAKATHPDIHPDDPDAPLRFRELMRAYDILIDTDQRTTYDELLAIALQPPAAAKSTRVYERVRKYASNTMAATIISGLLVAGYTLFGHFSNLPGAAEFLPNNTAGQSEQTALAATSEANIESARPAPPTDAEAVNAMMVTAALNQSSAPASRSIEVAHRFTLDNLWTRRDPVLAVTYLDRDIILYRTPKFDRAFDTMVQVRHAGEAGRPKISTPAPRKPSTATIPEARIPEVRTPLPQRRTPMIAALTP